MLRFIQNWVRHHVKHRTSLVRTKLLPKTCNKVVRTIFMVPFIVLFVMFWSLTAPGHYIVVWYKCFKTSLCVLHGRIKKNISCTLQFEKSEFRKIQCIRKVFTALHFFHILLCYSLIPKLIKLIIFLKILQTIPHNDNVKEVWNLEIKNEKISCT